MSLNSQKNRNPFVDFPWLTEVFSQAFNVPIVESSCPSNYFDPDTGVCTASTTISPSRAPTPFVSGAPSSFSTCDLTIGAIAIISFNTGSVVLLNK